MFQLGGELVDTLDLYGNEDGVAKRRGLTLVSRLDFEDV